MSNSTQDIPQQDLSDGTAPTDSIDLIQHLRDENRTYLFFKKVIFGLILFSALSFLFIGLCQSYRAINHLISTQKSTLAFITSELKKEECEKENDSKCEFKLVPLPKENATLQKESPPTPKAAVTQVETDLANSKSKITTTIDQNVEKNSNEKPDEKSEPNMLSQVSILTGSIITLIIVILAVGLTLLLTITKHVFIPRENKNNDLTQGTFDSLTTPIGSVIESIIEAVKKKFQ